MIYSTATFPVNPAGETRSTRAQVWAGPELKARDSRELLPPGFASILNHLTRSDEQLKNKRAGYTDLVRPNHGSQIRSTRSDG